MRSNTWLRSECSVPAVRRLRVLIPLALVFALTLPGVGQAQVGSNQVTVSPTQGPPGSHVTVSGTGWVQTAFPMPIGLMSLSSTYYQQIGTTGNPVGAQRPKGVASLSR